MGVLLADVTSLVLLSAAAERFSTTEMEKCLPPSVVHDDQSSRLLQAASSAIDLLMTGTLQGSSSSVPIDAKKTVVESIKTADDLEGIKQITEQGPDSKTSSLYKSSESEIMSVSSEVNRSFEDAQIIAQSTNQITPSFDETISIHSTADSNSTDRPLCMTFDSGIASPAPSIIPGISETYRPLLLEDANFTSDLKHRLRHLKICVEQTLKDSMVGITPCMDSKGATLSDEIGKHLCHVRDYYTGGCTEASLPTSHSSNHPENLSVQDLFVERALSSSLLVFENTKLSAEVAYLQKKVEILEQIAGTAGFTTDTTKPTMETISMGSQTDVQLNQSCTLDETDFGISDISVTSPETRCLMGTAVGNQDFCPPSGMSTPGRVPGKQSRRRKIEVPSQLKVASSTSYRSINPWAETDDKQQNGSSVGCWRGLCACFDRSSPARPN